MSSSLRSRTQRQKQQHKRHQHNVVAIPSYLSPVLTHYYDDIWSTTIFDEKLVIQLMIEGFLPIACQSMLLPKLHKERCIIRWPNFHTPKTVKKKCKRWEISINQEFDKVVKGCHEQHGISWLYPSIVKSFKTIHSRGHHGMEAIVIKKGKKAGSCKVRLYSIEIWNAESRELVAGELGYAFGNIYTSLTGFSSEDSAGSVQLAGLGMMLKKAGFAMWDLGMDLEYKKKLGAHLLPRSEFLEEVKISRESATDIILSCPNHINVKEILSPGYNRIQSMKKNDPPSQKS